MRVYLQVIRCKCNSYLILQCVLDSIRCKCNSILCNPIDSYILVGSGDALCVNLSINLSQNLPQKLCMSCNCPKYCGRVNSCMKLVV
jgi:hypothetical protein